MVNYDKALLCARFSQIIYQDFLKLKGFPDRSPELINLPETDTQCAIFNDSENDNIYIVFRGSDRRTDWDLNLSFEQRVFEFKKEVIQGQIIQQQEKVYPYSGGSKSGALMHNGFTTAYLSVRDQIHESLKQRTASRVTATGHSLGGALATLCAVDVQYNFGDRFQVDSYTYGSPRVGNDGFQESYNKRVPETFRFVYGMDVVPALPRVWQGYRHVDKEFRLGERFSINFISQRFKDHAIERYIAAIEPLAQKSAAVR